MGPLFRLFCEVRTASTGLQRREHPGNRRHRIRGTEPSSLEQVLILSNDLLAIIYVILALVGALIALLAWRGNRDGRERWCPVCDHDLSGTDVRTCPACGFHSTDERRFRAPRRRPLLAIVGLVLVLVPSVLAVGSGGARSTSSLLRATWTRVEVQPLPGGLEVVHLISEQGDEASFRHRIQVRNETNEVLLDWKGWSARLGFLDSTTAKRIGLGGDIDRNGEPDLVLRVQESAVDQGSWLVISIADRAGRPRIQPEAILRGGVFSDVDLDGHRARARHCSAHHTARRG